MPAEDEPRLKVSLASILELLDPISSNIIAKQQQGSSFIRKTKDKWKSLDTKISNNTIDDLKLIITQRLKSMDASLQKVFFHDNSTLEKAFYPFTLFNIYAIGFTMGKFPHWFHIYYTVLLGLLMPVRFYTYYKTNNHYFLADLCYFVNLLCLLYIWIWPSSENLYQSCFAFTFGSLSFAVITWRNSLVMHSIDKITSCFIHIMPPCTLFVIHHGISEDYKFKRFPAASSLIPSSSSWNLQYNIFWTSLYYLVWQSLYHYFITMRKSNKIKKGERMTSFQFLTTHTFKDWWVVKLPAPWPMVIYTMLQYFYQLCTMLLCGIWYHYKHAAGLFLMTVFLCAAHNGATYYIDYYGKKFEREMEKLKMEVDILQMQLNNKSSSTELLSIDNDSLFERKSTTSRNSGE